MVAVSPRQMFGLVGLILRTGFGLTFTTVLVLPVQPFEPVPVTVYVVVIVGFAVTFAALVEESPVFGAHV